MAILKFKIMAIDNIIALKVYDLSKDLQRPFVFTASNNITVNSSTRPGLDRDSISLYIGNDEYFKNTTMYHTYKGTKPHFRVKKYMKALHEFVEKRGWLNV